MNMLLSLVTPLIMGAVAIYAASKKVNVFSAMTVGAADGLKTVGRIFPALVALLSAVYMLRASGVLDALTGLFAPLLTALGIPPETASLIFLRPVSGSGALAVGSVLIDEYGADSLIGRTAAVMLGSTETTFYVISVYFGAAGVKKSRYAIPAALSADVIGFLAAAWTVRLLWY
jgi:spore maturation protein B